MKFEHGLLPRERMALPEKWLLPKLPFAVAARIHKFLELTIGDFVAVHPETRKRNTGLNLCGRRGRYTYNPQRNRAVRMERDVDLSCRAEYLIRSNKSIFDDTHPVIAPVGYLRKSDRRLAHELPFRKIVARCRPIVGHINFRAGRRRYKF